MTDNKEREAFEAAWLKAHPLHEKTVFTRSLLNPHEYAGTRVNDGWKMWQAHAALAASQEKAKPIGYFVKHSGYGPWVEVARTAERAVPFYAAPIAAQATHPDDAAVDRFAAAMKEKLSVAREKGRSGWEAMDPAELSLMLRQHVEKGDPRDVANFCMFLWALGQPIGSSVEAIPIPELTSGIINDACWTFIEAIPGAIPSNVWNHTKPALYAAVCHVLKNMAPQPSAEARDWRVALVVSSSDPSKHVRWLADGAAEIARVEQHSSFIRWLDTPHPSTGADKAIPMKEISNLVAWGMDEVVKNGANSISMPDDLVAVAYFVAHPSEFALSAPLQPRKTFEEWLGEVVADGGCTVEALLVGDTDPIRCARSAWDACIASLYSAPVAAQASEPVCNLWVDTVTKRYEVDHCTHPSNELIPVFAAPQPSAEAVRDAAYEKAARLIETTNETTTVENGGETRRHLTERKGSGNLTGMAWAAGIRALKSAPPQPAEHIEADDTCVICPGCAHQFRAIPVQVQSLMLAAGFEPPFTDAPKEPK